MDPNRIGFLVVTIIQVPSFFCAIYLFVQYAKPTSPLRRLQNHTLMCLLIVATWTIGLELPHTQKYLWTGSATIYTSWFCLLWNISFLSTAALNRILMSFMCIERHLFVFRPQIYHTRRSRLILHYLSLIVISFIVLIYFFVTNVFVSCSLMRFNYSSFMCGYTCPVLLNQLILLAAWLFVFIPTVLTIVSCVLLPVRFIIQKRQLQRVQWSRARKMIVQTSTIAGVYTICWLPYTIVLQLYVNNVISLANRDISRFFTIIPYMTSLVTPFIVFHTIQKPLNLVITEEIKRRFCRRQQTVVQPVNGMTGQEQSAIPLRIARRLDT